MPSRRARRRLLVYGLLAALLTALLGGGHLADVLATLRAQATDLLFATRPGRRAESTVIVGIDQPSYQALLPRHGPLSAWPRSLYARVIDDLSAAGARVIVFAVFFDAPKPEDGELAAAMRHAGNVVVPVLAQGPRAFDPRPGVAQEFETFIRAAPAVRGGAVAEGVANITTGRDSVVRSLPVLLHAAGETLPTLSLVTVARHARRPGVIDAPATPRTVFAAGRAIPLVEHDTMLINFLGPPSGPRRRGPFRIVSFVDVLERRFDPAAVRDRIVLIGPAIRGVDEHATPTTRDIRMWGVEILANAVDTILHQRFLVPVPKGLSVVTIAVLALMGTALAAAWRPLLAGLAMLAVLGAYVTLAAVLFDAGWLLDLVFPPAALLLAFAGALGYRVVFDEAEQRVLQDAMARYLSPAVSRWVLEDFDRLRLGGELREMTVLFSDLRRFTTLAHELPPEVVVSLLNLYRTEMTERVFAEDGVLSQYAGDAIEAFWNAPMDQPDHARRACATALAMTGALTRLQPEFARRGWRDLDMAVGINSGPMVVGNMGSRARLAYTAVGDAVNVAARLEGLSKEYGARLVVGEATYVAAGDAFEYRFLDVVAVVGRDTPLSVYELLGPAGCLGPEAARRLARYHEGLALYRGRRWGEALACFDELAASMPGDGPVELYRRRSREMLEHPPPPDWDGVHVAQRK
jgi:adenylate cyclase